ncbi:DUF1766-domain-containing protein [Melanomma pulvis-pyrius CBS 109.77]|uniref:DUF1766-domain-containing protein n=1 Tax=Melanomma pulvis-pyrius CBS 109.77 TaxID=1314802 RepID=A0A6A6XJA6_9PLEO|nr:DUF1766-domain-containing protein [Melanomma pulvis-pyrius CBS 109.77]
MAFFGQTPESLLPRSDSKNPATTCKGITKTGRPCRRDIDTEKASRNNGVLAVVSVASDSDEDDTGAAAFFCWQHKDQAEQLAAANAAAPNGHDTQLYPLKERSSIDTLVARLGVLEVNEPAQAPRETKRKRKSRPEDRTFGNRPPGRVNRPPTWDKVQGPLMSVPSDIMAEKKRVDQRQAGRPSQQKKPGFWAMCCVGSADDDYVEVVRHKKRAQSQAPPTASQYASEPIPQAPPRVYQAQPGRPNGSSPGQASVIRPVSSMPGRKPLGEKPARPLNKVSPNTSETSNLLSYIPKSLTPQLTSLLLAELSKPISPHDDEGYIYIFWLTPESLGPAPSSTASSLLAAPSRPEQGRRTSDVLRQYSVKAPRRPRPDALRSKMDDANMESSDKNTILLKIGRASNVHRRMNEWTRQCGYSLSLVRFYPYVSSTPSPSPNASPQRSPAHSRRQSYQNRPADPIRRVSEGVRKVPHAHRVERLIHIELGEQRVMKKCEACGKDHREWFEVDATREGVKAIDEVVKRWVLWAERANN